MVKLGQDLKTQLIADSINSWSKSVAFQACIHTTTLYWIECPKIYWHLAANGWLGASSTLPSLLSPPSLIWNGHLTASRTTNDANPFKIKPLSPFSLLQSTSKSLFIGCVIPPLAASSRNLGKPFLNDSVLSSITPIQGAPKVEGLSSLWVWYLTDSRMKSCWTPMYRELFKCSKCNLSLWQL